jgi:hypothetical protein
MALTCEKTLVVCVDVCQQRPSKHRATALVAHRMLGQRCRLQSHSVRPPVSFAPLIHTMRCHTKQPNLSLSACRVLGT